MDSFLTRSAKKLEQALGVPRPWELTPPTAIGYQLATGEGSIGERARKGTAQFIGRYVTNIKEPWGYDLPSIKESPQWIKSIITDKPPFLSNASSDVTRDTLSREMFDLPQRSDSSQWITKTGPKNYTFTDKGGYRSYASPYQFSESTIPNAPEYMKRHPILGNVELRPFGEKHKYYDIWDLVSPYDENDASSKLRRLVAPILRPATVSGEVFAP